MNERPARCPQCSSKLLQPHSTIDTFDRVLIRFWQCTACGVEFDYVPRVGRAFTRIGKVRPITLAPGELNTLGARP